MEAWIFLVLVGSGYLAQRWKNAMKMKDGTTDRADDFQTVVSSNNCLVSSTRRGGRKKKRRSKRNDREGNTSWYRSIVPICDLFPSEGHNFNPRFTKNVNMHEMENTIDRECFNGSCAVHGSDMLSYSDDCKSLSHGLGEYVAVHQKSDRRCGNDRVGSNKNVRTRGFSLRRKRFESQRRMIALGDFPLDKEDKNSMEHGETRNAKLSERGLWCGLPSLPRIPSSRSSLRKAEMIQSDRHDESGFLNEGASDLKSLLFNFGVGVGMMSTIMSNMHVRNNLLRPIEEAGWLLEGLESELHRGTSVYEGYDGEYLSRSLCEKNTGMKSMIARVRSTISLLNGVKKQLFHGLGQPDSANSHSEEMLKMEAELKAELERIEIDINARCLPSDPSVNEFNSTGGHLIEGELYINNLPHGQLFDREEEECSSCNSEDGCFLYSGVSPVKLASCLHELIEARQEEKMVELKNELEFMERKLQANEHELHLWRKGVMGISGKTLASYDEAHAEFRQGLSDEATSPSTASPTVYEKDESIAFSGNKLEKSMNEKGKSYESRRCLWPGGADGPDQFLSMIEDSSSAAEDSEFTVEIPTPCKGICNCPEPKEVSASSRYVTSSENDVIHKFGMEPSFVKSPLELRSTKCGFPAFDQSKRKMVDASHAKPFNFEWSFSPEEMLVDTSQDIILENHGRFRSAFDRSMSQESAYPSDLDERLGQLLIDRIVEKSRRNSSVNDVAHSILASFDQVESTSSTPADWSRDTVCYAKSCLA